jgi:hypothetical protein
MLLDAHVPQDVFARPLVRSIIIAKWRGFAMPVLKWQAWRFGLYFSLFVVFQVGAGGGCSKQSCRAACSVLCTEVSLAMPQRLTDCPLLLAADTGGADQRPRLEHPAAAERGQGPGRSGSGVYAAFLHAVLGREVHPGPGQVPGPDRGHSALTQPVGSCACRLPQATSLRYLSAGCRLPEAMALLCIREADVSAGLPSLCRDQLANFWTWLSLASHVLMPVLFALHLSRANDQLFRILVAVQLIVLYLRFVYFFRASRQLGAMMSMLKMVGGLARVMAIRCCVLPLLCTSVPAKGGSSSTNSAIRWRRPQVMWDARLFMLVVLLIVGGAALVFNTLLADSSLKLGEQAEESNRFGMMDRTMMQLFSFVLGGVDYDSLNGVRNTPGQ